MDQLIISKPEAAKSTAKLYAHIRCSTEAFEQIERIERLCNMNKRKVCDALLAFALKRVKFNERKLYDLEIVDIGTDQEEAADEDQ